MGHDREQFHEITCPTCQEEFTVAMGIDFDNTTFECRCVDNCEHISSEGLVINIDPYSPIPKHARHQDMVFPWLEHASQNLKIRELVEKIPIHIKPKEGPIIVDVNTILGGQHLILDDWAAIKKGWSLTSNSRSDRLKPLSHKGLKNFAPCLCKKSPCKSST